MPDNKKCPESELSCLQDFKVSCSRITYKDLFDLYQRYHIRDCDEPHSFKAIDMSCPESIWKHGFYEYSIHWERPGRVFTMELRLNKDVCVIYRVNIIHLYVESSEVQLRIPEE